MIETKTIDTGDRKYRITTLNALEQGYIALKFMPAFAGFAKAGEGGIDAVVTEATKYLSALSYDEYTSIVAMLLKNCEVSNGGDMVWSKLYAGNVLAYNDVSMTDLFINIIPQALVLNFSPFFQSLASKFPQLGEVVKRVG